MTARLHSLYCWLRHSRYRWRQMTLDGPSRLFCTACSVYR